ncbi:MAG: YfhO family protein [Flavobacteriaceae bacterium]|nr:YfhO family protein [Flavobacteriaceae bacterium]
MKKIIPYIITLIVFIVVSLAYFYPVLQGKKIAQSDIIQFTGSVKEINDYRVKNDAEPYWTNTSFSGMPAYSVSVYFSNNYIQNIDKALRFLPRPADYLFLYFTGFFVLLLVLRVDWKLAIIGSLAFGFSTYYIIILGVGHNAKAHAIAYFPLVLAGIISVFRKRYLFGFVLTSFAMALEVNTGHPQMTYYLMFSVLILGFLYLLTSIKQKTIPHFAKSIGILSIAVILGIGVNATRLLATKQYTKQSTRSESELTITPSGKAKEKTTGLDREIINMWSYGFTETFNLFIPRFMGGASNEQLGENSKTYQFLKDKIGEVEAKDFIESVPTYWGKQPGVSAPAYIGAILIFLFVLGIFIVKNDLKKWLVCTVILSLLLSYGKNFSLFTDLFIDYVPLYTKFRAVTSVQVLAEFAIPLLGILALKNFFSNHFTKKEKYNYLKLSLYIVGGLALFFTVFGTAIFSFENINIDRQLDKSLTGFSDAVISDRKSIFFYDSLRTLLLVIATAGVLFGFMKNKLTYNISILTIGILILFDLVQVNKRYVNSSSFTGTRKIEKPFTASKINLTILKDKSHYRVGNFSSNLMNEARTSYFHNSIGGYHAAKPRRYQELFDFHSNNLETLNMLNTKYFIFNDEKGNEIFQENEAANGNVWFVNTLHFVNSADKEIKALDSLKTKIEAVIFSSKNNKTTLKNNTYPKDTTAIIKLTKMETTKFTYNSFATLDQFAVFSEMYFKDWVAYIDGIKVPIIRVNYVLRALEIPKGKHEIIFEFQPKVIKTGNQIVLISYILLLLIPISWWFMKRKKIV